MPLGTPPQGRYARPFVTQRTTMAQTRWPHVHSRRSRAATLRALQHARPTPPHMTAVDVTCTDLRDIDILSSRAPQPCAHFISTITNPSTASPGPPLHTDYTKWRRLTTTSRRVARALLLYIIIYKGIMHFPWLGQGGELAVGREKQIGHMRGAGMEIEPSPPSYPDGIRL